MVTPRTVLGTLDPNIISGRELTPYKRGQIEGIHAAGISPSQITTLLNISRDTVKTTIIRASLRTNGASQPRSGRPRIRTPRNERLILRTLRANPTITYAQLCEQTGLKFSRSTFTKLLKEYGISHWIAKKRPFLTTQAAKARLQFALEHRNWTYEEWKNVIFTDECSLERGSGARRQWVYRTPQQKWDKDMIVPYMKGKDITIMIWAAIWANEASDCVILYGDREATHQGVSSRVYLKLLKEQIPRVYQPGRIFMQDNAPIHTAKIIQKYLEDEVISVLKWPPYSPDLNPIENLWAILKERISARYPHLQSIGKSQAALDEFADIICKEWALIEPEIIENCIRSLPARMEAVIAAKGWYTRY